MKSDTQKYLELNPAQWRAVNFAARLLARNESISNVDLARREDSPHGGRLLRALALYYRLEGVTRVTPYRCALVDPVVTDAERIDRAWWDYVGGVVTSTLYWLGLVVKGRNAMRRQLDKLDRLDEMYSFGPVPFAQYCAAARSTTTFAGEAPNPHNYLKDTPSFEELVRMLDDAETVTEAVDALVDNFNITRKVKR